VPTWNAPVDVEIATTESVRYLGSSIRTTQKVSVFGLGDAAFGAEGAGMGIGSGTVTCHRYTLPTEPVVEESSFSLGASESHQ